MNNSFEQFSLCYNWCSLNEILTEINFVKKGKKELLSDVASVFDIEASSFYIEDAKQCCMYAWVFGINGKCIKGRTWEEFEDVLNKVVEYYNCNINKRFIIYVHNLSYEFQWIKKRFKWYKVFSVESRQPIYAIANNGIEFRCSYMLSGYSLANVGKNLTKYKVKKMVGDLDYKLIRHSKTPLTDKEWGYILNDGLVVMAYIQEEKERMGSIKELPYTKTGYVRQLCRDNCLKGDNKYIYSKYMKNLTLTSDDYAQLKRVFTGGFTHANNNYVNKIVSETSSFDFTSSYPAVMLSEKFPMSKSIDIVVKSKGHFMKLLNVYCCMFDCIFYNIKEKVNFEHYISKARCRECENYILDNGRIVSASKLATSLTEQDFFIILETYTWDYMDIGNFKIYRKEYLPKDLILTILKLYRDKTILKGVKGKEVEYMVSKGMLNSCYGMAVTDPCKDENIYDNELGWYTEQADLNVLIERYNKSNTRCLYYPWGVWITAYARRNLFTGILEFKDDYVYSDTDSIKCLNIEKHKQYIENYNINIQNKIRACLKYHSIKYTLAIPKTINGIEKKLGIWDYEGTYSKFKTLGAKRYMYLENDKLHITISGVKKETGVEYLKYKFKTFDKIFKMFNDGLTFPAEYKQSIDNKIITKNASGKLCHTYIDNYMCGYVTDYLGITDCYCEYSGVHMEPTSYNLNLDAAFKNYILRVKGDLLK